MVRPRSESERDFKKTKSRDGTEGSEIEGKGRDDEEVAGKRRVETRRKLGRQRVSRK